MGEITISPIQNFPLTFKIFESSNLLDKLLRLPVGSIDLTHVACGNRQIDSEDLD